MSLVVAGIAVWVMAERWLGLEPCHRLNENWATMKQITAILFLLSLVAVWCRSWCSEWSGITIASLAVVAMEFPVWIAVEETGYVGHGVPSIATAVTFAIFATAAGPLRAINGIRHARFCYRLTTAAGVVALVGYATGIKLLRFEFPEATAMAFFTAVCFTLLGVIGLLAIRR